jgi:hypothetical protein
MSSFTLVQVYEQYIDYDAHLRDSRGVGCRIRVTLVCNLQGKPTSAYMVIAGDTIDGGDELFYHAIEPVPLGWAKKLVGYKKKKVRKRRLSA